MPTPENAVRWVERTPDNFVFNIKTYGLFTRHQTPVISLPKSVREALGPVDKKNVYDKDVPEELQRELWAEFREVLEILRGAGKLGAVHMQFAPWVAFHPENFEHLEYCRAMLAGFDVAVEFRNKSWFETERKTARTLEFERQNGASTLSSTHRRGSQHDPVGVEGDEPGTGDRAFARTQSHDRNKKGLKASSSRFDYDYEEPELLKSPGSEGARAEGQAGSRPV